MSSCPANDGFSAADERFMRHALMLAARAEAQGEVPVGALLVLDGEIIGEGWNQTIGLNDPSAHAEIVALRDAGRRIGNYRFPGAVLYVSLEPCCMCAGAIIHARLGSVIYAADDPKTGAAGSRFDTLLSSEHNHQVTLRRGLLEQESAQRLRAFFRKKRKGSSA